MSFLLNNKIWLIVVGGLAGVLLSLWLVNLKLNNDIKSLKEQNSQLSLNLVSKEANLQISNANLSECNAKLALQNAQIKQLEAKKINVSDINARIQENFKEIKALNDDSCKSELNFYKGLINEAFK